MAPFIANTTYGMQNFKWILYGDDDTVFFIDNVLDLVKDLDHNMPYFISDAIWWPNWSPGQSLGTQSPYECPSHLAEDVSMPQQSCPSLFGKSISNVEHGTPRIAADRHCMGIGAQEFRK